MENKKYISDIRRAAAAKSAAVRAAERSESIRVRSSVVAQARKAAERANIPLIDWVSAAIERAAKSE
jgi:predicted HicB family RNase H-like nuclease